jgi:hypothetical protein
MEGCWYKMLWQTPLCKCCSAATTRSSAGLLLKKLQRATAIQCKLLWQTALCKWCRAAVTSCCGGLLFKILWRAADIRCCGRPLCVNAVVLLQQEAQLGCCWRYYRGLLRYNVSCCGRPLCVNAVGLQQQDAVVGCCWRYYGELLI